MTNQFLDTISQTLGTEQGMDFLPRPATEEQTAKDDFKTARTNIKELIEQGMGAIPTMIHLMQEAQSDKMYVAGARMLETLAALNANLVKMAKEEVSSPKTESTVNQTVVKEQHVYVGTTEAYLEQKRQARKLANQNVADEPEVIDVEVSPVTAES